MALTLYLIFNQAPALLVEGDDDERIWQQAVRSGQGRIKVYPCSVDGIAELNAFEQEVARILESVYDNAIGFSLRDRDLAPAEIDDIGPVKRMRLYCRAAENLLLSDEALLLVNLTWEDLLNRIDTWLTNNAAHPHYDAMRAFADSEYDRANSDLKEIRNDLVGLMGSNKPWEVIVGQALASLRVPDARPDATSMISFLGPLVCRYLLGFAPAAQP